MMSSTTAYRFSGLRPYNRYPHPEKRAFDYLLSTKGESGADPIPPHTIVTPLYIDLDSFLQLRKSDSYRAFFIMRDPRDVVVSTYFSWKYSHAPLGRISEIRSYLGNCSLEEGLIFGINWLRDIGLFQALISWIDGEERDERIKLLRFEELVGDNMLAAFRALFRHCDIRLPDEELASLLQSHSFQRSAGRSPGQEDVNSHNRKGIPGDWQNYFTDAVSRHFATVTHDLVHVLGY